MGFIDNVKGFARDVGNAGKAVHGELIAPIKSGEIGTNWNGQKIVPLTFKELALEPDRVLDGCDKPTRRKFYFIIVASLVSLVAIALIAAAAKK